MEKYQVEWIKLEDIKENPDNPRRHPKAQVEALRESLRRFGPLVPAVVGPGNVLAAGHGRIAAARLEKLESFPCVRADALSPDQLREFALADNQVAGLSSWDDGRLFASLQKLGFKDVPGFRPDELRRIEASAWEPAPAEGEGGGEDAQGKEAVSKPGDLWLLGRHKLACGDATNAGIWERLMGAEKADLLFTDPPYGVDYGSKNEYLNSLDKGNRIQKNIANDTLTPNEMLQLWKDCFTLCNAFLNNVSAYYVCSPQGGELMMMMQALHQTDFKLAQQLIWVKNNFVLGRSDYHYRHEPIFYGWKNTGTHQFYANTTQDSILQIPKPSSSEKHPTMKPPALVALCVANSTQEGGIVVDPFAGSGSAMVACEKTRRTARMIEIDPSYCDAIVERYERLTGGKAERA